MEIYTSDPGSNTNVTPVISIEEIERYGNSNNRRYYNKNDIELTGVSMEDTIYIRYSVRYNNWNTYYVTSVKVQNAVNGQVTLTFTWVN